MFEMYVENAWNVTYLGKKETLQEEQMRAYGAE